MLNQTRREPLDKPYGFFGRWETKTLDLEVVGWESKLGERQGSVPLEGPLLVSVNEAAKLLGISRASLYEMIRAGEIEHVRVGKQVLAARGH